MVKELDEDLRRIILQEDKKKDLDIRLAISAAAIAIASSLCAIGAMVMMKTLDSYRENVSAYWLSCAPFVFQLTTGLHTGFKKNFGSLGVHIAVTFLALLIGGLGYGSSIKPILIDRENCTRIRPELPCNKESLIYLYVVFGGISAALAVCSIIFTFGTCAYTEKRLARRKVKEEVENRRREREQMKEMNKQAVLAGQKTHHPLEISTIMHPGSLINPTNSVPEPVTKATTAKTITAEYEGLYKDEVHTYSTIDVHL